MATMDMTLLADIGTYALWGLQILLGAGCILGGIAHWPLYILGAPAARQVPGRVVGVVLAPADEGEAFEDAIKNCKGLDDPAREVLYPVFAYDLGDGVERWARAGEGGRYVAAYRTGQKVMLRVTPGADGDIAQDVRRPSADWAVWAVHALHLALPFLGLWMLFKAVGPLPALGIGAVCALMALVGVDWRTLLRGPPPDRPENVDRAAVRPVEEVAREAA